MNSTELVKFLSTEDFTDTQAYNLLVADMYDAMTEEEVAQPAVQKMIGYMMYKIQVVCLAAIREAKTGDTR